MKEPIQTKAPVENTHEKTLASAKDTIHALLLSNYLHEIEIWEEETSDPQNQEWTESIISLLEEIQYPELDLIECCKGWIREDLETRNTSIPDSIGQFSEKLIAKIEKIKQEKNTPWLDDGAHIQSIIHLHSDRYIKDPDYHSDFWIDIAAAYCAYFTDEFESMETEKPLFSDKSK